MTIAAGAQRREPFTAEGRLLTDVGGTLAARVLSTPGMIGVMERTCAMLAYEQLDEGQATVGFEVCVKHVAAAAEGTPCVCQVTLQDIVDGRKLRFAVEARALDGEDPDGRLLGIGTHERRVIDVSAHAAAAGG